MISQVCMTWDIFTISKKSQHMYFWKWNQMTSCEKELIIYSQIYKDFVFVQSLSHVWLFVIPWGAALPASLSFTISRSLLKIMSIVSLMPFNHLFLCCPLLLLPSIFPSIGVFSRVLALHIRWSIWASASASVLPMNIQCWFPLGLTGLISLLSKGLSRKFKDI